MPLLPAEISRYRRHLSLEGFGPAAQERLKSSCALVIGAGGLGCPALLYLAAAGVGRIVIVDDDRVDASNLQRQVLFETADQGVLKAEAAARRLRSLNPLIAIEPRAERLTRNNALALVRDCDVVIDGSDNFATRYLVNDACVLADRPLVYGAIQGFEGQLSVFNWKGGPTYRCLFPEPPPPGSVPTCSEAGVLGVLPGLIGTAQAAEAIKILAGIGEPLSGRLLLWNALDMVFISVALVADPRSRDLRELPPEGYGRTCESPARPVASHGDWPEGDEIGTDQLRELIAAGRGLQLIDVRELWERQLGSIEPSHHIPIGLLATGQAGDALAGLDPGAPTVVYCAAGVRSLRGIAALRERHGFRAALSLRGGYHDWPVT